MGDERWRWAWSSPDGSEAGHLGMTFVAATELVIVTATLARPGHDLVALTEPDAPWPRPGSMEIRASGLWADAIEEERGARWTLGLEAFALAVDDPAAVIGRRVPLGFDLEWERAGPDHGDGRTPATVHGEVLVEDAAIDIDASGWWQSWGLPQGHR